MEESEIVNSIRAGYSRMACSRALTKSTGIMEQVNSVVVGKEQIVKIALVGIIAGGHILIEDIPGVGKTTLAMAFSKTMSLKYNRLQFTPDVMPSDVTGFSMFNKEKNKFEYKEGIIMCNLFLADEINRTSSKTQSALLEAMEEGSVTVDGVTRTLPEPFTVIATQNPAGSIGTSMLPESQLDRFMFRISMGYPNRAQEIDMLSNRLAGNPLDLVETIINEKELIDMRNDAKKVYMHECIREYIVDLVNATREHDMISLGVSPRGSITLSKAAKAYAYIHGRDYVVPDDVRKVFYYTVNHRIRLSPKARAVKMKEEEVIADIGAGIQVRKEYGFI